MTPKKPTPSRPPIRAKSALPAPRVSEKRVHVPWHQRKAIRVVLAVLAVIVLAIVVRQVHRYWHHHTVTAHNKTAVKAFDTQFQSQLSPLNTFVTQAQTSPAAFAAGLMGQPDYVSQTAQWLATANSLRTQLSSAKTPAPLASARAQLVTAADVLIDSINQFQLAGTTTDKATVKALVQQGTNTLGHGLSVLENAVQAEEVVVNSYGLPLPSGVTPSILKSTPQAPPAVIPVQSPVPSPSPS